MTETMQEKVEGEVDEIITKMDNAILAARGKIPEEHIKTMESSKMHMGILVILAQKVHVFHEFRHKLIHTKADENKKVSLELLKPLVAELDRQIKEIESQIEQ